MSGDAHLSDELSPLSQITCRLDVRNKRDLPEALKMSEIISLDISDSTFEPTAATQGFLGT